jgi:hypothetical protein
MKSLHTLGHNVTPAELTDTPHITDPDRHSDVTILVNTRRVVDSHICNKILNLLEYNFWEEVKFGALAVATIFACS